MLTGTPLDLTPFGGLLSAVGLLYWGAALLLVALALWRLKRWWLKLSVAAVVLSVFVVPVAQRAIKIQVERDAANAKLAAATRLFEQRCQTAGERIKRTVDNVDGVVWLKWRDTKYNLDDQFRLDDPYGRDCSAEKCIEQLLRASTGLELDPENKLHARSGYRFVETTEPKSQELRRYRRQLYREKDRDPKYADWAINSEVVFERVSTRTARYGITWDDISTREDREHWIAGGSIKVIDLQTNEVIAERVGYMMDRGQGSTAGARSPWAYALSTACPRFPSDGTYSGRSWPRTETFVFVSKVLQPTKE